uniref:Uncharacterized protein n=1 Tax=Magallana gigas TaxID=29159 RepID=A0A8W8MGR9_MAGGI
MKVLSLEISIASLVLALLLLLGWAAKKFLRRCTRVRRRGLETIPKERFEMETRPGTAPGKDRLHHPRHPKLGLCQSHPRGRLQPVLREKEQSKAQSRVMTVSLNPLAAEDVLGSRVRLLRNPTEEEADPRGPASHPPAPPKSHQKRLQIPSFIASVIVLMSEN